MKRIYLQQLFTNRAIATFYLVLMCVQILFLEGFGVSPIKVVAMVFAPFILIVKVPYVSKATILGGSYLLMVILCASMQSYVRFSTIGYLAMFVITFIMYYNLIYSGAFSSDYFIKLLRTFIFSFFICALLQQLFSAVGIKYFPLLNMVGQAYLAPNHFNTLTFEPSSSARIMAFLFLAYLRMHEYRLGNKPSVSYLWNVDKWVLIAFLYTMIMMGSGTAVICIAVLSLFFVRRKYVLVIVPLFFSAYLVLSQIDYLPLQRALNVFNATMTLDVNEITETDGSAAVRINPLVNTLTKTDLTLKETWFGKGTVSEQERSEWYKTIKTAKMGNIDQYGLLSYLIALSIIFGCCIPRFLSIETLLVFVIIGMTINNFSYIWGCYFILAAVKYFSLNKVDFCE